MGRLKKRAMKTGSGAEVVTDMNTTEQWVWEKFSFLRPRIETLEARNVVSFSVAGKGDVVISVRSCHVDHTNK